MAKTTRKAKIHHLLMAYSIIQDITYSNDEDEITANLGTVKHCLNTVFPADYKTETRPLARKLAEITLWFIHRVLENKLPFDEVNIILRDTIRACTVDFESDKKGGKNAPSIHKTVSK